MNNRPSAGPASTFNRAGITLFLIQLAIALTFFRRGVYADQFDFVPILEAVTEGDNWIHLVFLPHGDHWHTGAYILMLMTAHVTDWSLLPEALTILLISLTGWLIIQNLAKSSFEESKQLSIVFPITFAFLYFLPSNAANFLWTWQISTYLVILGLVTMLFGLSKVAKHSSYFLLAVIGAGLGTISFATGFVLWPVGLVVLVFYSNTQGVRRLLLALIWLAVAAAFTFAFVHFRSSAFSTGITIEPILNLKFLAIYLGATLAIFSRDLGIVLGFGGISLFLFLLIVVTRQSDNDNSTTLILAVGLGLFGIFSGILISLGRLGLDLYMARSSRYMIFSSMFWIAVSILLYRYSFMDATRWFTPRLRKVSASGILVIVLSFSAFSSQRISRGEIQLARDFNETLRSYVESADQPTDFFLYPNSEKLNSYLTYLETRDLNLFR